MVDQIEIAESDGANRMSDLETRDLRGRTIKDMHFSVDHLEVAEWDTIRVGPPDRRSSAVS